MGRQPHALVNDHTTNQSRSMVLMNLQMRIALTQYYLKCGPAYQTRSDLAVNGMGRQDYVTRWGQGRRRTLDPVSLRMATRFSPVSFLNDTRFSCADMAVESSSELTRVVETGRLLLQTTAFPRLGNLAAHRVIFSIQ